MSRVTVLMAVYNGAAYLQQAIDSVLAQTYADFELLVVNDGSTDQTREILESYADPRLRVIDNPTNLGLTKSLNVGLSSARGELVARQDDDDVSFPERLSRQVQFLDAHSEVAVVGSEVRPIDARGRRLHGRSWARCSDGVAVQWQLMFESPFAHSAVMSRRSVVWDEFRGYDEMYRTSQDFELWSRIGRRYGLANLPQSLVAFRSHPNSVSKSYSTEGVEKVRATLRSNMQHVLGDGDYERWLEFWVTVNNARTYGSIRNTDTFLRDFRGVHARFVERYGRHPDVRRHAAAMLARVSGTLARTEPRAGITAYAAAAQYHPLTAFRSLPRFSANLLFGRLRGGVSRAHRASSR